MGTHYICSQWLFLVHLCIMALMSSQWELDCLREMSCCFHSVLSLSYLLLVSSNVEVVTSLRIGQEYTNVKAIW